MKLTMSDGVELNLETRGDAKSRLVLCLHGFPQSSHAWLPELERLAADGYYAVAPDLRGYGKSDKPDAVSSYKGARLALDVKEIILGLGRETALVVSHDWGAVIGWLVAAFHPEVVERLVIINGPHPDKIKHALKSSQAQRKRSWYIFFFQLPILPELFMKREGTMKRILQATRKDAFSPDDVAYYQASTRAPGAARAMINYYRASARYGSKRLPKIKAPTLVLWGEQDVALGQELLEGLDHVADELQIQRLKNASHWVMEDAPNEAHAAIRAFLA